MPRPTTLWVVAIFLLGATSVLLPGIVQAGAPDEEEERRLTDEEAKSLKSPIPYTKESITRGKILYLRDCTECHGMDGKSQVDVIANATDLTDPEYWVSGTSEGEVFRSIRDGAGDAMPPFLAKVETEDDLWHMVNFVRSLWPASARPKLVESPAN